LAPSIGNNPNWIFVKLHTHGGIARNYDSLLGNDAFQFHEELQKKAAFNAKLFYHYATAREMTNMIHAAEDGLSGNPSDHRNYLYKLTSLS
jgi:coenzyme F420-reducing hydrogenase alpha subunit